MRSPCLLISHVESALLVISSLRPVRPHIPFYRLADHIMGFIFFVSTPSRTYVKYTLRLLSSFLAHARCEYTYEHSKYRHLMTPALTKAQLEIRHRVSIPNPPTGLRRVG